LETNSTRIPEKSKDRTNKTQARQFNQNAILKKKRMMAFVWFRGSCTAIEAK